MQQNKELFRFVIFSAVVSGIAGIFTFYSASYSALFFLLFSLITIIPIFVISLMAGIRAGAISTLIALVFSCLALPFTFVVSLFISLLLPALFICFTLNIVAINKQTKEAIWLPLSTILFNICIVCVVVVVLLASYVNLMLPDPLLSDTTFAMIKTYFDESLKISITSFGLSNDEVTQLTQAFNENFVVLIIAVMAWSVIGSLFFMLLLALYAATRFVAEKKLSPRPRYFWPRDLIMPVMGIFVFFVAIIACSFSALNYTFLLCMLSLAIAFALGFLVSGIAFVHNVTVGKSWRIAAMAVMYILLFSFVFSSLATLILIGLGVASTALRAISDNNQKPTLNS